MKFYYFFIFVQVQKKLEPVDKELKLFFTLLVTVALKNKGAGDPESGKNVFRIRNQGAKKHRIRILNTFLET
jgi:hypothetical protein